MDCNAARDAFLDALLARGERSPEVQRHVGACPACAEETRHLVAAWQMLETLPGDTPSPAATAGLSRRLRRSRAREALTSLQRWQAAALTGVVGFVLSLLLGLLMPYESMVAACRALGSAWLPGSGIYALAGLVYGLVPMLAVGRLPWRTTSAPGVVDGLASAVVFLAVLLPYALLRCEDFPAAGLAAFLGGVAGGALAGGIAAVRLGPRPAWS